MSESRLVWQPLKKSVSGFWMRIEVVSFAGFPDTLFLYPDGRCGFVELKIVEEWPKRPQTRTKLNIRGIQADFLKKWCANGGRGYVLARVRDEFLLISGERLIDGDGLYEGFSQSEWREKACAVFPCESRLSELNHLL